MSHMHEREEKICLNCGAQLTGRYCPDCGQENVEPKESFWHLVRHFFEDITHFDGKLFATLKYLLFRPGFLTEEYIKGRRASYLNPIRMYLFISAMFFLIFMSFFISHNDDSNLRITRPKKLSDNNVVFKNIKDKVVEFDTLNKPDKASWYPKTVHEYDSSQKALPKDKRDDAISQFFAHKGLKVAEFSSKDRKQFNERFKERFFHSLPQTLFLSLPLAALLLFLLYIRRRQKYFYVSHIIFTLHIYCFVYLMWLFAKICTAIGHGVQYVGFAAILISYFYLYKAMRRFYQQSRAKTIFKWLILVILFWVMIGILLTALMAVSAFGIAL